MTGSTAAFDHPAFEHPNVTVVDHPLVRHKLTLLRMKETPTAVFRNVLREISFLLAYEVTKTLELEPVEIDTPLERMRAEKLAGKKVCFVSVLRAGNGLLEGMLDLVPSARVGHIGLYRDPVTLAAVEYYLKLPDDLPLRDVVAVDPMLATANSSIAAVHRLKEEGASRIKFVCLLAAPEGIRAFTAEHPDVPVFTAAVDRELDDHGYIRPGLGDAGDRIYGTK
jgi:uracil phosphoribosyltransferase